MHATHFFYHSLILWHGFPVPWRTLGLVLGADEHVIPLFTLHLEINFWGAIDSYGGSIPVPWETFDRLIAEFSWIALSTLPFTNAYICLSVMLVKSCGFPFYVYRSNGLQFPTVLSFCVFTNPLKIFPWFLLISGVLHVIFQVNFPYSWIEYIDSIWWFSTKQGRDNNRQYEPTEQKNGDTGLVCRRTGLPFKS